MTDCSYSRHKGPPVPRSWSEAAAALAREAGLEESSHQHIPHELVLLKKKFLTKISTVIGGTNYTWEARHHRRNRPQRHESQDKPELLPFKIFNKDRIEAALSNPVKRISFWVGPLFFFGSLLFVFGTASEINTGYWEGEWSTRMELLLVDIPFFVGALAFLAGCYASFVEVVNVDFSDAWDKWEEGGRKGPPPPVAYAVIPTTLNSHMLSFYGTTIQYIGSIVFLIGSTTEIVHTLNPDLSENIVTWLLYFPNLLGGFCFTAGAYFLAVEGSHSMWRGMLPPLRGRDLRSVNHWVEFQNWAGSVLFLLAGVAGFVEGLSVRQEMAVAALTWLAGSAIFVVQGALLYLEIVNPAW